MPTTAILDELLQFRSTRARYPDQEREADQPGPLDIKLAGQNGGFGTSLG
jgi:hypothetical protein